MNKHHTYYLNCEEAPKQIYRHKYYMNGALPSGKSDWTGKPADWSNIRKDCPANSIALYAAHKDNYSQYDNLGFTATCTGGYKVYIDEVLYNTYASGATCSITWSTSGITTGDDITTPSAMKAHKIWIEPATEGNNITAFSMTDRTGLLWLHSNVSTEFDSITNFVGATSGSSLIMAVTAKNNVIKSKNMVQAFGYCQNLEYIPILDLCNSTLGQSYMFYRSNTYNLKKIVIQNLKQTGNIANSDMFNRYLGLEEIILKNSTVCWYLNTMGDRLYSLKKLPEGLYHYNGSNASLELIEAESLEPTYLDCTPRTNARYIKVCGTNTHPMYGIKGLRVSNQAPFDGTAPQINVSYTGMDRTALVQLFNDLPYNVGYTVVGSPTISNGVVSGFSNSDGLQLNSAISQNINTFEYLTKARMDETGKHGPLLARATGSEANFAIQGKSHRFNIYNDGWLTGSTELSLQTWYWFKVIFDGTEYKGYTLQDNNYTINTLPSLSQWDLQWATPADGKASWVKGSLCALGTNPLYINEYLQGSIDLNNTYIKVNDIYFFRGQPAMTKTLSCVGCTGTADLTAEDKDIALNKGWSLTLS